MRLIFLGSPDFAVPSLEALHASDHRILAVVTQPDRPVGRQLRLHSPPVKLVAERLQLPVFQPETTRTPEFVQEMKTLGPDLIVVVAYGEILRPAVLQLAPRGALNLHASLLPKYRGAAPVAWAILQGEQETGCSTMLITEVMDAGPVLLQESCGIDSSDTTGSLTRKLSRLGASLLRRTIDLVEKDELSARPQEASAVSFAPKLRKMDGLVDWTHSSDRISRQVRAFDPWPGTFSSLSGIVVKLWIAVPAEERTGEAPGTLIRVGRHEIQVACGQGTVLRILELQPENRPRLKAGDFANGVHLQAGIRFVSVSIS